LIDESSLWLIQLTVSGCKGDAIKCPPDVPHWHGASHNKAFVQVAVTNNDKGTVVWLEKVTDSVYNSLNQ
jgi:quercetin dioxygenase-like cupin family protein